MVARLAGVKEFFGVSVAFIKFRQKLGIIEQAGMVIIFVSVKK